ncbi:MAG TPA: dUTP diphosphatase [Firmicutes bacterium]|nr:dUTP diphosphatase [Bacillota bacterium]
MVIKNRQELVLEIEVLPGGSGLPLPAYQTPGSSGMDLFAAVTGSVELGPQARALIPTGIKIKIPAGYEGQVRPRSGLAIKNGISVLNTPGTIDSDYRGEVKIILFNAGKENFIVKRGDRIAQLVIVPVFKACLKTVDKITETDRNSGGFGSTGV